MVCACVVIAGCSIGKPIPQATTYVIELPAAMPTAARRPETLRMGNVHVAAPFAGDALVYRMDEVRYTADPYNAFIAEPARMLGSRMAQWLDRAGPFRSVVQPESVRGAPYILEATVSELYGDFRPGYAPAAVVTVQFALLDLTGTRSKVAPSAGASISRRHRPVRWCAGMARRLRKSYRSSFPTSAMKGSNRRVQPDSIEPIINSLQIRRLCLSGCTLVLSWPSQSIWQLL